MTSLNVTTEGDGAWPDMLNVPEAKLEGIGRLRQGTSGGNSSVGFRLRMPDGSLVLAQTTMRLFLMAAEVMKAAEEREANNAKEIT